MTILVCVFAGMLYKYIHNDDSWYYAKFQLIDEIYIGHNIEQFISPVGWEGVYNKNVLEQNYPHLKNAISHSESNNSNEKELFYFISWGKPLDELRYQEQYKLRYNSILRYIGFPVYKNVSTAPMLYLYCTDMSNIWDYGYGGSNVLHDEYNLPCEVVIKNNTGEYEVIKYPTDKFDIELNEWYKNN